MTIGPGKLAIIVVVVAGITFGVSILRTNIIEKKAEGRVYPMLLAELSDEEVSPEKWGKSFPSQFESYARTQEDQAFTPFGGSLPYSKLIRFPQLTRLWGGYAFAHDFNEERGHYYTQIDQIETMRNNQAYLNAHGLTKFKGQPGACMNCHSAWIPKLVRDLGWPALNKTPYLEVVAHLEKSVGKGSQGSELGSSCSDCHHPSDMSLRVTRPAYINAMAIRGYEKDEKAGLKGTRNEMRSHVCQQCHVEYYFQPGTQELTYPWSNWPKNAPFEIEMFDAYYDALQDVPGAFRQDWTHAETGAPMLKMQHPETELFSAGIHARSGVSCADCHMPFKREGAIKVSDHHIRSPLLAVEDSCRTCHSISQGALQDRVASIQNKTARSLREAEGSILALMDDISAAKVALAGQEQSVTDAVFQQPREFHRRASMRWDFVASENSTGFHAPQEAQRILGQAIDYARRGQLVLQKKLQELSIALAPTVGTGTIPEPGSVIGEHHPPVGAVPPAALVDIDARAASKL
jgi:nitrite reductase (cytochrome c-552)